jgi:hypothetical protein
MVVAWHRHGMACVNQMGKTQSKPLAARHGREQHCMCELALRNKHVLEASLILKGPLKSLASLKFVIPSRNVKLSLFYANEDV